jgi:hypothetical protein
VRAYRDVLAAVPEQTSELQTFETTVHLRWALTHEVNKAARCRAAFTGSNSRFDRRYQSFAFTPTKNRVPASSYVNGRFANCR